MNIAVNAMDLATATLLGLVIGSFLNVVIHRLPQMLERQWARECADLQGQPAPQQERFNLLLPRSRCGHCGHAIRWYENIPLLSFVLLRGRCSACGKGIGWRYPLIELLVGLAFAACAARWGFNAQALAWAGYCSALICLAAIDWDTTLLPDDITLPLLWAGLLASVAGYSAVPLKMAVIGAAAGYLSLWSIYWLFKLTTGKEGMGYGDFKLLAALGAWLGAEALIPLVLMASVIGAVVGIAMKLRSSLREGGVVPFGPFLAGAGLAVLAFGDKAILGAIGL